MKSSSQNKDNIINSKGNSMERKSNLPIPKGKENNIPRIVNSKSLNRKSTGNLLATGSLSANSSPLQSCSVIMSTSCSSVIGSSASVIMSSGFSSKSSKTEKIKSSTSLSANSSPLQMHTTIANPIVIKPGSNNLSNIATSGHSLDGTYVVSSSGFVSQADGTYIVSSTNNSVMDNCGPGTPNARSVIVSAQNSPGTLTLAMNSKVHTPEMMTMDKFFNSPGGTLTCTPTMSTSGSVSTPTYLSSGGPRLNVPWNTPATGYKPSPSVGVQYTLSPATRTVYTTSYSLSPQELTNKLIHYEKGQQNNRNPADTSPKSNALYLTSDKVPDIHNIILAKMKHNRRRAKQKRAMMQSPVVVPSPSKPGKFMCQHNNNNNSEGEDDIQDDQDPDIELEEVFQGEGESVSSVGSVASSRSTSRCNSQDERITDEALETNFRTLFEEVDFCHSGTVSSQRLLSRIMELMCVNPEEKWRIDEFSRLIDPRHDDRFVDVEQFVQVGKTWIENMFEREMRNDKLSIGDDRTITERKMSTSWSHHHQDILEEDDYLENDDPKSNLNQSINASFSGGRRLTDNLANASFGSVEGYGGDQGCYSREVELENRCSELRYQLYRQQEEYQDLRRTLASTEDMAGHLSSQLDAAKARISGLTAELDRLSCSSHDAEEHLAAGRQAQHKCRSLALELEQLKDALSYKDSILRDRDEQLNKLKQEVDSLTDKEQLAAVQLLHREAELAAVTEQLQKEMSRREELGHALAAMEMDKLKSEDEVSKLQQQIVNKDLELKDIRNLSQGLAVLGNQSVHIHGSNVLDVSVDDKVFDDMSGSQSPTPRKGGVLAGLAVSPHPQRFHEQGGPSASSTPCREKRGSIVDELKEAVGSAPDQFPSPLCGKGAGTLASKLQREILKWENAMRRAVIEEAPSACSGKLVTTLNKTMQNVRKDVITKVETFEEEVWEREEEMKRKLLDLRAELDAANQQINQQSINKELEYEEEKELELVESRLTEMAQLLNTANKALLASTNQADNEGGGGTKTPVSNEVSYDEDLLTHWNLDLDGLELVEWNNNLSRKLMQYTKHIREEKRAGTPSSKLWLSLLHSKLDELHTETEKSRELLLFAGESIREDVSHHLPQSSLADQPRPTITLNGEALGVRRSLQITEVESRGVQTCLPDVRSVQTEMGELSAPTFPKTQSCQTSLIEDKPEAKTKTDDNEDNKPDHAIVTRGGSGGGGVFTWLRNLVSRLGSHSKSQSSIRQTSADLVKARQLNSYLSLNDLNATEPNPNYNSHYKSLPNLSSDASMTSADSTPLMQHPLCQTNSYYSDSTTDANHDSNTIENSSTVSSSDITEQEFSGELEFAAAYTMELSQQQSNSSLIQTSEKSSHSYESSEYDSRSNDSLCSSENSDSNISQNNTKSSTKSNVSADNNFNNLATKKPPHGSHLQMLAAAASPSPATVQRRYRIQSCDIMETGSWIICDNLF